MGRHELDARAAAYDVVIVGASIAGCTAAALYGRQGLRVALIERNPDPLAHKTVCTTYIQASAAPVLERLGAARRLASAGAVRDGVEQWTRWGWIRTELDTSYPFPRHGYSVRRATLDPLLRHLAAGTPGVELVLGTSAHAVTRAAGRVTGVVVRGRSGDEREFRARLVVGADGRRSRTAELAGVPAKTRPHGRIAYFAHYTGVAHTAGTRAQMWFLEPDVAYVFPQDGGVTVLAAMPTRERLPEFRADPERSLERYFEGLPGAPSLAGARRVSKVIGKIEMTNSSRPAARAGIAFVGDAAMAADPLWGVGCGFALQSAEWLVECTADALRSRRGVDRALRRYRRRHRRALGGHYLLMSEFATGRPFNAIERTLYAAAVRDQRTARHLHAYGSRSIGPARLLSPRALARAAWVNLRHDHEPLPEPAAAEA